MRILRDREVIKIINALSSDAIKGQALHLLRQLHEFRHHPESILQPSRLSVSFPTHIGYSNSLQNKATTLYMPTLSATNSALKVVTISSSSLLASPSSQPLTTTTLASPYRSSLFLFSSAGELESVLNAYHLTAYRTALSSLIPFLLLYDIIPTIYPALFTDPTNLNIVIFGAGLIAEYTASLLIKLFNDRVGSIAISIFNRSLKRDLKSKLLSSDFATNGKKASVTVSHTLYTATETLPNEVASTLRRADAIFCCTPSTEPLFPAEVISSSNREFVKNDHQYISLIGSYTPDMREIDPVLLNDAVVIVDNEEACRKEAGEIIAYCKSDYSNAATNTSSIFELGELYEMTRERYSEKRLRDDGEGNIVNTREVRIESVYKELKENKEKEGRNGESRTKLIVYKGVGFGFLDLVIGKEILKDAEKMGIGSLVEEF